jgi:hypothetical protein
MKAHLFHSDEVADNEKIDMQQFMFKSLLLPHEYFLMARAMSY